MTKYLFVVLTNAVKGQDDAFNDWYTNRHLSDVLRLAGYKSAQRFKFVDDKKLPQKPATHKYLALYEVETDDLEATHANLVATAGGERMPWGDAFDRSDVIGWYYAPITEKKTAP